MASVFDPSDLHLQAHHRQNYLAYLKQRDGAPDRARRRLETREAYFTQLATQPVHYDGPALGEDFWMVMRATSPYGMPPLALWMAIAATANEGEKFSVERIIDSRQGTTDPEDPMTYVEIEEIYHTRLLIQTVSTLGVPYEMKVPPLFVRVLTMGIILLPKPLEYMVVFFAEVIGTTLFAALAERARSLVDPQSPVGARVISLVEEILIDEIGHVTYARAHLGPVRLWIAKQMTRFLARAMYKATPAIDALFDANILAERAKTLDLSTLPAHILARAYAPSAVVEAERISAK